jgi:hypothetical protein
MKIISKSIVLFLILPFLIAAGHIVTTVSPINITGKWKCIKHDYRGKQKFSLKQAEFIRQSILDIKTNTFAYSKAKFIKPCTFQGWKRTAYDTSQYDNLELIFTKAELQKITVWDPVNAKGVNACFNECAIFYLKHDTLINVCGGYTFYRVRTGN